MPYNEMHKTNIFQRIDETVAIEFYLISPSKYFISIQSPRW